MLVTPFAIAIYQIGMDRGGPLMTVIVPWDIPQPSSRVVAMPACVLP
jgi:hypothetical protein